MLVTTDNASYKEIADALREKQESENVFTPAEMAQAVRDLKGGDDKAIIENTLQVLKRDDITKVKERTFFGSILEEVNLPNCATIGENAFYECHQIKKIYLPEVTEIAAGAFYLNVTIDGTEQLEEVDISKCTHIWEEAFATSSSQRIRKFRLNAPSLFYINGSGLANCEVLTDDKIEERLTYLGEYAFKYGSIKNADGSVRNELNFAQLESVSPSNVFVNFKAEKMLFPKVAGAIGTQAFGSCTAKILDFGAGVTMVRGNAFSYCTNLEKLILRATTLITNSYTNTFNGSNIANGTGFIYVPDELVDSYKAATNWSKYAAQIKPLSELPAD